MAYLVNSREIKRCDQNTIKHYGVPSAVLMERAALAVFYEITARFSKEDGKILIVCGAGNNGGDGFALARLLYLKGYHTEYLFAMDETKMTPETKAQYESVKKYGVSQSAGWEDGSYAVIADALFGIGLARHIEGELAKLLEKLNRKDAFKIAVDISSGISADNGHVLGTAFCADLTVTFGFAKTGHLLYPGAQYTGELITADIGIDAYGFLGQTPPGRYLKREDARKLLPKRTPYSNKGTYGKALIIAGSPDMAGAAYFAAKAAYYGGCGLVRILTPYENRDILLTRLPEAILTVYDAQAEDLAGLLGVLAECMEWADAVLAGPGLGCTPAAKLLVAKTLQYAGKKAVFDADALNILSSNRVLLKEAAGSYIVTPHLGEMARLTGQDIDTVKETLLTSALDFAEEYNAVCVLKDARTVVGMPDGTYVVNATGNCGMATAGSGDVLAGFLTGLLAQGMDCENAAALAVYLHGAAGDIAAERKGTCSMIASDLLENLWQAVKRTEEGEF